MIIRPRGKYVDEVRIGIVVDANADIRLTVFGVSNLRHLRGVTPSASFPLNEGGHLKAFKHAIADLEESIGGRFEAFEVVDATQLLLKVLGENGYSPRGFKALSPVGGN